MHMTQAIQIMQQTKYNMTNEYNLIPENETDNKSKNPAPVGCRRTARLWIRRLEGIHVLLLDRAYTYIMRTFGLGLVHLGSSSHPLIPLTPFVSILLIGFLTNCPQSLHTLQFGPLTHVSSQFGTSSCEGSLFWFAYNSISRIGKP